jgi:hypothetical protein
MKEAACSSKTLGSAYYTAMCHYPDDYNINLYCCENLESYTYTFSSETEEYQ